MAAAVAAAAAPVAAAAGQSVEARGTAAGATLLTRSLLGADAWAAATPAPAAASGGRARTGSSARTSFSGPDGGGGGGGGPVAPPSPSSSSSSGRRSRRGSASLSRTGGGGGDSGGGEDGELEEPQPRNMDELNDMLQELQSAETHTHSQTQTTRQLGSARRDVLQRPRARSVSSGRWDSSDSPLTRAYSRLLARFRCAVAISFGSSTCSHRRGNSFRMERNNRRTACRRR